MFGVYVEAITCSRFCDFTVKVPFSICTWFFYSSYFLSADCWRYADFFRTRSIASIREPGEGETDFRNASSMISPMFSGTSPD